jgi:HPt (histidine-containing phosphotransfer) domain-containing protein
MSSILTRPVVTTDRRSPTNANTSPSHWVLPEMLLDLAADGTAGLIADLIDAFRTDTQLRLKQVRHALGDTDIKGIRAGIHSIKGCAQQMGANAMASMCLDIELVVGGVTSAELSHRLKGLETEFGKVRQAMAVYSSLPPVVGHYANMSAESRLDSTQRGCLVSRPSIEFGGD